MRWGLPALVVLIAVAVACWPRGDQVTPGVRPRLDPPVSPESRAAAALAPCTTGSAAGAGALRGLTAGCLADGRAVDLAVMLAGRPALLNLWAYWCQPCARELPLLQAFAARMSAALTVITVHSDAGEGKALARLAGLGIHLPGVHDPGGAVRAAVGAPAVLPVSVLIRADGSVAKVLVREFTSEADIAAVVRTELGVAV